MPSAPFSSPPLLKVVVLTLFPEIFPGPLGCSLLGKGLQKKIWHLDVVNIRDFAQDKHHTVDDRPYGGGPGMVMLPEVVHQSLLYSSSLLDNPEKASFFYMTPRGQKLTQGYVEKLMESFWTNSNRQSQENFSSREKKIQEWVILCGRFEGVDQRVLDHWPFQFLSIGDYILCGGEIGAMVFLESCLRLLPGILGNPSSFQEESFSKNRETPLEGPLYTRPEKWLSYDVPEILLSGHHEKIAQWRNEQGYLWAQQHRPDLFS